LRKNSGVEIADGNGGIVPLLDNRSWLQRIDGLKFVRIDTGEGPVRWNFLRRREDAAAGTRKCCASKDRKMNGEKVRTLPVHARCSERRDFPERPLVRCAAKVSKEPSLTDAALSANGCYEFDAALLTHLPPS